jgi:hypothetical protein
MFFFATNGTEITDFLAADGTEFTDYFFWKSHKFSSLFGDEIWVKKRLNL